jgi:hypothetical protein
MSVNPIFEHIAGNVLGQPALDDKQKIQLLREALKIVLESDFTGTHWGLALAYARKALEATK